MFARGISISNKFFVLVMVVILINAFAYMLILKRVYENQLQAQAKTVVANVEAFGAWVALHGRVWVKADSEDSYLGKITVSPVDKPEEVLHFFSKNPALAQREFSEVVAKSSAPAKFRMTSHNVMNPVNKPDDFENIALAVVRTQNKKDYSEFVNGEFRFAQAVYHKASCIACHGDAKQAPADVLTRYGDQNGFGFKEGDVAGIISVTIPVGSLLQTFMSYVGPVEIAMMLFSIVVALWFVRRVLIKPIIGLTEMANEISTGSNTQVDTAGIDIHTRDELGQLKLALSRMRNSTFLALKKMREAQAEKSR